MRLLQNLAERESLELIVMFILQQKDFETHAHECSNVIENKCYEKLHMDSTQITKAIIPFCSIFMTFLKSAQVRKIVHVF